MFMHPCVFSFFIAQIIILYVTNSKEKSPVGISLFVSKGSNRESQPSNSCFSLFLNSELLFEWRSSFGTTTNEK